MPHRFLFYTSVAVAWIAAVRVHFSAPLSKPRLFSVFYIITYFPCAVNGFRAYFPPAKKYSDTPPEKSEKMPFLHAKALTFSIYYVTHST